MRSSLSALLLLALAGCPRLFAPQAPDAGAGRAGDPGARRGAPELLPPCAAGEEGYLARAAAHYDEGRYPEALACAAQAAGADPTNPDAQAERAATLVALSRLEEARVASARALALDPDHEDALIGAADLYLARLPFSREYAELGLSYALRGRERAMARGDLELVGRFSSLAATALNDLGRGPEAVERAEEAILAGADLENAHYERASALWELCRFAEARREFEGLVDHPVHAARAHYHLGLIAERDGDAASAGRHLARARELDPEAFAPEPQISAEAFAALVARAVQALPEELQRDLQGVPVSSQDLPDLEDLVAVEPPLSPTIVGLFRGPSLGESCPEPGEEPGPCRAIVLYRKTMARSARDLAELERQVEITLLHEIGHLRGEDDIQLVARGLE